MKRSFLKKNRSTTKKVYSFIKSQLFIIYLIFIEKVLFLDKNTINLKQIHIHINIFNKYINKKYTLIPFNTKTNNVGNTKYFPASSKEWKNNIYSYNQYLMKNVPSYDVNISKLIKGYFNMYLNHRVLKRKHIPSKRSRKSLMKIFVSKPEIKHTNSKIVIMLYTYNAEKLALQNKIRILRHKFNIFKNSWNVWIFNKSSYLNKLFITLMKRNYKNDQMILNLYNKIIKFKLYKRLKLMRRYKLRFNLNNYKFKEVFLNILGKLISKFYNKKVEFNIIKLKSIANHVDIFTEILKMKLRKKGKLRAERSLGYIIAKAKLSRNEIIGQTHLIKSVNFNLIENKYKNLSLNNILNKKNFHELLNNLYNNFDVGLTILKENSSNIKDIIFNSIHYKSLRGIRIEIKGRLTKRYRADRATSKKKWEGGLRNIDSYKGLSSVKFRGYKNSNVEYSLQASKRRIGSFAVKGWISGK